MAKSKTMMWTLGLVVAMVVVGCVTNSRTPPQRKLVISVNVDKEPPWTRTVTLSDYSVASPYTKVVHIVRLSDGQFLALSGTDPKGGCTVSWNNDDQVFVNPCHGAVYDIRGEVKAGPAVRGLDRFPLRVDMKTGKIHVDVAVPPRPGEPSP